MKIKGRTTRLAVISYIYIFIIIMGIIGSTENRSQDRDYLLSFLYMIPMIIGILYRNRIKIRRSNLFNVAMIMFFIWSYGIVVGLILKNGYANIFRNFAGMALYIIALFFINAPIDVIMIRKMLIKISYFSSFAISIGYLDRFIFCTNFYKYIPILNSYYGTGMYYMFGELMFISLLHSMYQILILKKYKAVYFITIISTCFAGIFATDSGGDALAIIVMAVIMIFSVPLIKEKGYKRKKIAVAGTIFVIIFSAIIIFLPNSYIAYIFSDEDWGNSVRYAQIRVILSDLSLWGKGLGAPLLGVMGREASYAVEIIYLNLFHKFGIFALGIIGCYIYTFFKAIKLLQSTKKTADNVVPLGSMGYLIVSLGNPMLFIPAYVIVHCLALLILQDSINKGYIK